MKKLLFTALALTILSACAGDAKKPPLEFVMTEEASGLAEEMRTAYVAGDRSGLIGRCAPGACEGIAEDIRSFQRIELEFRPKRVEIGQDGAVRLHVFWTGKWTLMDMEQEGSGVALFEFRGRPLRLSAISGENPFIQPDGR